MKTSKLNLFRKLHSKKTTVFLVFFISFCLLKFSAQTDGVVKSKRYINLVNKLEGAYQVQVLESRDKTEIPLYFIDTIQAKRHLTEILYFPLKNNLRVMVLPFLVINKKGFQPLERIANVSSDNKIYQITR